MNRSFAIGVVCGFTAGVLVAAPPWAHRYLWIGAGLALVLVLTAARKAPRP